MRLRLKVDPGSDRWIFSSLFIRGDQAGACTVVIVAVEGDLHEIGKNLVAMMLQGNGFKVIDLGTNIKPEDFVAAVKQHNPQIVGMSALLTTTMLKMEETIEASKEASIRDQVKSWPVALQLHKISSRRSVPMHMAPMLPLHQKRLKRLLLETMLMA